MRNHQSPPPSPPPDSILKRDALAVFRRRHGLDLDVSAFIFSLAVTLGCAKPGRYSVGHHIIVWHGLDIVSLREAVRRVELGPLPEDELAAVMDRVLRWQEKHGARFISAKRLGELLEVTAAEREELKLWFADAIDEPKAVREVRKAAQKRDRDRERKTTKRAEKNGHRSRYEYEANSITQTQSWVAAGYKTRRMWERHGKPVPVASVSVDDIGLITHADTLATKAPPASKDADASERRAWGLQAPKVPPIAAHEGASADVSFTGRFEAPPLTPHPETPQLGTEERPQTLPEPHLILQNEPDEKPETVPDIERLTVFMNGRRLSKATLAAIARAA